MESSPWVVFRWSTLPKEVYGRGPVLTALPDIKTINKTKELVLKNASMAVSGAWTVVDDGIINIDNINIEPAALIPVQSNPGSVRGPSIAPLETGGDFNVAQLVIQDMQRSINDMMFADPLGPIDMPVKTATEISIRQQQMAERVGSAYGRLHYEFVTPLLNRLLHIMEDLGLVDLASLRIDGNAIDVEYISPLAQAQDQEEMMNLQRFKQDIVNTFGPQMAMMLMKPDRYVERMADNLNIPQDVVPSEEEFEQMKAMIAQMAQGAMGGQ
jgi:hypothetical protein